MAILPIVNSKHMNRKFTPRVSMYVRTPKSQRATKTTLFGRIGYRGRDIQFTLPLKVCLDYSLYYDKQGKLKTDGPVKCLTVVEKHERELIGIAFQSLKNVANFICTEHQEDVWKLLPTRYIQFLVALDYDYRINHCGKDVVRFHKETSKEQHSHGKLNLIEEEVFDARTKKGVHAIDYPRTEEQVKSYLAKYPVSKY